MVYSGSNPFQKVQSSTISASIRALAVAGLFACTTALFAQPAAPTPPAAPSAPDAKAAPTTAVTPSSPATTGDSSAQFGQRRGGHDGQTSGSAKWRDGQTSGGMMRGENLIKNMDKNGDGKLSKDEFPAARAQAFDRMDSDKDGFITKEELQKMAQQRGGEKAGEDKAGKNRRGGKKAGETADPQ